MQQPEWNSFGERPRKRIRREDEMEKLSYKNYHHTDRAFDSFNAMRKQNLFCDVTLEADCGSDVQAHKMVLAACSPYFYAMFTTFEERDQSHIKLHGIDHPTLESLMDYIYTAEIDVNEGNVQILLPIANLLQLTDVNDACCDFLQTQLHPLNCLGIQAFADIHGCSDLLEHSSCYIEENFSKVVEGDEFLQLVPERVAKMISSDFIEVSSEEKVFECVMSWVRADLEARQSFLDQLMEHVRLPLLSDEYLLHCVEEETLINASLKCQGFLIEALKYHLLKEEQRELFKTPRTKARCGAPKILSIIGGNSPNSSVECFDLENEKWFRMSELPMEKTGARFAVLDGRLYLVGGSDKSSPLKIVNVYDSINEQWSSCAEMKSRRFAHDVAVIDDCIYAAGGFDGHRFLNSVEVYEPRTDEWRIISPMLKKRVGLSVGVVNGILYAVGGFDQSTMRPSSTVECYDPEKGFWKSVARMSARRCGAGVGVIDGILYAAGGENDEDDNFVHKSVEAFDPETNQWKFVADMTIRRRHHGVVVFNGLLYVIGGSDGTNDLDSVEVYSPKTDSWRVLPGSMSFPRRNVSAAITVKSRAPILPASVNRKRRRSQV